MMAEFYGHSQFGKERAVEFRQSVQGFPKQTALQAGVDAHESLKHRRMFKTVGCDRFALANAGTP